MRFAQVAGPSLEGCDVFEVERASMTGSQQLVGSTRRHRVDVAGESSRFLPAPVSLDLDPVAVADLFYLTDSVNHANNPAGVINSRVNPPPDILFPQLVHGLLRAAPAV